MLRLLLISIGALLAGFGGLMLLHGDVGDLPMVIWGVVILLAVALERWRYQKNAGPMTGDWEATDERFVDSESGQVMQVMYQPSTGERRYIPAQEKADQ